MKHYDVIEKIAASLEPNIYVELGIYRAKTFNFVARHAKKAYAVDSVNVGRYIKCDNAEFFCGTTDAFARRWTDEVGNTIDLIFIDADHSKEAVLRDVGNFLPWITPDTGFIILHDTWPLNKGETAPGYSGDCYLAPRIIKERYPHLEVLTLPFLCGLTLIRNPTGGDWRNG